MNKTLSIALAGYSFIIEETAYLKLSQYLDALRATLETEEAEEVMHDIETRIVEIFRESLEHREVVNTSDVEQVIAQIGTPEIIEEQEERYYAEHPKEKKRTSIAQKQLFRDTEHKMIGGVCSGLGYYFGIDKIWVRLIFVILFFASFSYVFFLYIVLLIMIPKAKTASDILKMKGEPANFDNIKAYSNKVLQFTNASTEKIGAVYTSNKCIIKEVGNGLCRVVRYTLGGVFMLLSGVLLISSIAVLGIGSFSSDINFFDNLGFYLQEEQLGYLAIALGFLTIFIPAIIFTLLSIKLLSPKTQLNYTGYVIGGLVLVWAVLASIAAYFAVKNTALYSGENEEIEKIEIRTNSDSLFIEKKKVNIAPHFESYWNHVYSDKKTIFKENFSDVEVIRKNIPYPVLSIIKTGKGYNYPMSIHLPVEIRENSIYLPNFFSYPYAHKFRNYDVDYILYVPFRTQVISNDQHISIDEEWDDEEKFSYRNEKKAARVGEVDTARRDKREEDSIIINGVKKPIRELTSKKRAVTP